jgi:hypothetical protein
MTKFLEQRLRDTFSGRNSFKKQELEDFFRLYEPELNEHTFKSRIYWLKHGKVMTQLDSNTYTLALKKDYQPWIDTDLGNLINLVTVIMLDQPYCVWNSDWVNEFSRHQVIRNFFIIEANKEELTSLFYRFKDKCLENVFLNPKPNVLDLYARDNEVPIVLKPLISRSPVMQDRYESKTVFVPTLEKILVDLFTDTDIFYFVQGAELRRIFEHAIENYAINFTRFFAYARRRNKSEELDNYLKSHFEYLIKRD